MTTTNILLLASSSSSRQKLLTDAQIPYKLVPQSADESVCDKSLPLAKLVEAIAVHKMAHVTLADGQKGSTCFVLTADTLSQDAAGNVWGKPANRHEAIAMLVGSREGVRTGTAFCLDRKVWQGGSWQVGQRIICYVEAQYIFAVPDAWLDTYLDTAAVFGAAGAVKIEGFGSLFLGPITGSYTTIVGLPMYELRQSLEKIGFFKAA